MRVLFRLEYYKNQNQVTSKLKFSEHAFDKRFDKHFTTADHSLKEEFYRTAYACR